VAKKWTPDEAKTDALAKHPDCAYADWENGIGMRGISMVMTIVVKLWRTEECWLCNDPPRHVIEGYES
jgi:hypothetical protein